MEITSSTNVRMFFCCGFDAVRVGGVLWGPGGSLLVSGCPFCGFLGPTGGSWRFMEPPRVFYVFVEPFLGLLAAASWRPLVFPGGAGNFWDFLSLLESNIWNFEKLSSLI